MPMIVYRKTDKYRVWRDTGSHCGYTERIADGVTSPWYVCIEGAEALVRLRRMNDFALNIKLDITDFARGATVYDREGTYGHINRNLNEPYNFVKGD